jgi:hypothetical protein
LNTATYFTLQWVRKRKKELEKQIAEKKEKDKLPANKGV